MYEKDFPIYSLDFIKSNKHWISYYGYGGLSPYYAEDTNTGLTIPNCVPFTYGYWHCLGECTQPKELKLSPFNANSFWTYPDGYARSSTVPKIGAIACWEGGSDGYGHIAIVIGISNDGKTIKTLNSAYKSTIYYERTLDYPFNFRAYNFQGFIYCPYVQPNPEPKPEYKFKIGDDVNIFPLARKQSIITFNSDFTKMLVICSLILMVGGGVYTATYICLYYPLLITNIHYIVNYLT